MNLYYWVGFKRVKSRFRKGKEPAWGYVEAESKNAARALVKEEAGYGPDEIEYVKEEG